MTDKLKQIIEEEVVRLPKEIQDVVNSFGWENITEDIGKKFKLTESEVNDFQVETLLVLVGLESKSMYALNIEDNVGTSKEEAAALAEEATKRIFDLIYSDITEKIKTTIHDKNPGWEQTLEFILSGGDYSAFLKERESSKPNFPNPQKINIKIDNSKPGSLGGKFVI